MEELRPRGVCSGGAGRVSCWQCVHGKTWLSALLLCHLAWAVWIMSNTQTELHPRARCSWDAQPGCVLREALLGHHQAVWEGWWAVEPMVVTRHQLSSSPTAQPCSQAELPAPSTSPWVGKHRGGDEPLPWAPGLCLLSGDHDRHFLTVTTGTTTPRSHLRCGLSLWSFIHPPLHF